ncbi:FKBP-type peptidyl-prolyl cis-trans isomerase [Algibacter miyuki]|uniref:Peptidyl-prolyl cis-trans isomerase n=1 Tax=Algibacter miyuki TaxID=1306933 RepID=A0ABV5GX00_9FLAO|nr:FKBP-type peptidyl-prolyl cis-trans isomerase [Algibacter miyuki]MDN3666119.1 FKBP-type peptidyl-prolyl cis-trans isomerase [Algibacter miyuki]
MKIIKILSVVTLTALMSSCNNNGGVTNKPVKTELDSVSYAIGMDVAKNVKRSFTEFDKDLFMQGFSNVSDSTNVLFDEAKAQQVVQAYFQKKQQEDMAKQQEAAAKKAEAEFGEVKIAGEKFLEENKSKDGVKVTESGLQYIVEKEGNGEKPTTASQVKVHYHGTLTDGTIFDSSVDRGEPATFGVTQVIPGWTEGLQLMTVGSKYKFFVPQELGYGATPRGGKIKPFDVLVFDVELLEIVK